MKTELFKKVFILLTALLPFTSMATNYYVDPSAGGTNSGTLANPWTSLATLRSNMSSLVAGDIVSFKCGQTYTATPVTIYSGFVAILNITKSGSFGSPITFNSYGAGAAPKFTGATAGTTIQAEFYTDSHDYLVFDGLEVYDPTIDTTSVTRTVKSKIERAFVMDNTASHTIIQNCVIRAVGVGANWYGDYNTMTNCYVADLTMVVDTNDGSQPGNDDDYGANPVVLSSSNNTITHNYFYRCWAHSYDYTVDGGAVEFFGNNITNNYIAYNKIVDCIGVLESAGTGGTNCKFHYNLMINNGNAIYFHSAVTGYEFYNNTVIENVTPRDATGTGFFGGSMPAGSMTIKNNIFQLGNGVKVKASATGITYDYNIYKISGSSSIGYTANTHDITTSATLFTSTTGAADVWDYYPVVGGPQIAAGANLSLPYDFVGNTISASTPTIGHLEYIGLTTITTSTISPLVYCAGGSISIPFTTVGAANGGNTFTAEMSTSTLFTSPITLGTLSATSSGTVSGTIPGGTGAGTYYVHVISSSPSITGSYVGPITVSTATPAQPGTITPPTNANGCLYYTSGGTYSISAVTNATSYLWSATNGSVVSGGTTTSAQITFSAGASSVSVQAVSGCGTSAARTLNITKTNPSAPTSITGPTDVCPYKTAMTQATYSVAAQPTNANSFTWTVPTNTVLQSGQNTTSINVSFDSPSAFTSGSVQVVAVNGCGTSSARILAISKDPTAPGSISGNAAPCKNTDESYAVVPDLSMSMGYSYTWTFPASVTNPSPGNPTANLHFDGTWSGGNIRVSATNGCGTSSNRQLTATNGCPRFSIPAITSSIAKETVLPFDAIYPNPSNGNFRITVKNDHHVSTAGIEILNEFGQLVYKGNEKCSSEVIDLKLADKLMNGIYLVNCTVNKQRTVRKLVINK